jgi:hypothetical protein
MKQRPFLFNKNPKPLVAEPESHIVASVALTNFRVMARDLR